MDGDRELTLKEKVRRLPDSSGVYIMKDALGQVVYIGKALNLKKRVSHYFRRGYRHGPKIASLVKVIADFDWVLARNDAEAVLLESRLIKQWKPRYNTLLKDNKQFLLLRVTTFEELPRFLFARQRKEDGALYFGPYLSGPQAKAALGELKKLFGILLSDAHPEKIGEDKWRLYSDARADIYEFENEVSAADYAARVEKALDFLRGRNVEVLENTRKKMAEYSENLDFERAAKYRDLIFAMEETLAMNRTRHLRADISKTPSETAKAALSELRKALGLKRAPQSIECFDISHISGSFCVASMVRFEGGLPAKQKYRRFKIKSFVGNDDFRAMNEVVLRRYSRLKAEGSPMPDVVLIDGGAQQVAFALKAFEEGEITPKRVIGLAKKEETIVLEDGGEILLSRGNEALRLLQRVRDEAHRFANSFSEELRSKKIRESILDDFPGLGEKRKAAILKHFGGIAQVRAASAKELAEVDGIGLQTAEALFEFLRKAKA